MAAPLYDDLGQRLTDCCAAYSTYAECGTFDRPGETTEILCCKSCYHPVAIGQGDGTEFRPGVTSEAYFRETFRRQMWRDMISQTRPENWPTFSRKETA
jgi:hypothetical protein